MKLDDNEPTVFFDDWWQGPITRNASRARELLGAEAGCGGRGFFPAWGQLFRRWANKSIALAGDSLMRNFISTLECAAASSGALLRTTKLLKVEWGDDGSTSVKDMTNVEPNWESWEIIHSTERTQAYVWHKTITGLPIEGQGAASIELDYFAYRHLTRRSGKTDGELTNPNDYKLVSKIPTLVEFIRGHDEAILNMGHDMFFSNRGLLRAKLESLLHSVREAKLESSIVFMEHPAQHFPWRETGDFINARYMNHTSCGCNLRHIGQQRVAQRNRVLSDFCRRHGLSIARVWKYFATKGCDKHRPPDCTHYTTMPSFWEEVARLLDAAR